MLKAGANVTLDNLIDDDGGQYEQGKDNPLNTKGLITGSDERHSERLIVVWNNGGTNSYRQSNLKLITATKTALAF